MDATMRTAQSFAKKFVFLTAVFLIGWTPALIYVCLQMMGLPVAERPALDMAGAIGATAVSTFSQVVNLLLFPQLRSALREELEAAGIAQVSWSKARTNRKNDHLSSVISVNSHATISESNTEPTAKRLFSAHNMKKFSIGRLAVGGVLSAVFVSYYTLLETTCANTDPSDGAGELVITMVGGSTTGKWVGTRYSAPLYVNAGAKLAPNGTGGGALLWVENLCDDVLDCSSCPFVISSQFNTTSLSGKILLYDQEVSEEIYLCGLNRLGRTFGGVGLRGLAFAIAKKARKYNVPGYNTKTYRHGEFRDVKPRNGDAGIPFPHFALTQAHFTLFMNEVLVHEGVEVGATITPTEPNPWSSTLCGYWKPLSMLLILGHVVVAEQAVSNLIGHVRTSGLRLDLAQLALVTEAVAHCMLAVLHHDPLFSFHWAVVPFGGFATFIFSPMVLTFSSTLLLAAFWYVRRDLLTVWPSKLKSVFSLYRHQMIAQDGLASVACESKTARVLVGTSILMDVLTFYFVLTEVSRTKN